ncbi:MSCRAMM family protein [Enterococcus termitis]|uniref:SpaA-like prealbumin fold domain-containing protein n=1 Tax=Enterococcus termitis TaxID=332950 RepID=A0A1E5GA84_9ENTE|nr:SpaA isopeptide-forming pilin-related protein [Enterococcus termitis]OEG09170.1 hypothetical protein BCR25_11405 [Enterococcus termitis]
MKQKFSYLLIPFIMFLIAMGLFNGQAAEAASTNSTWATSTSANGGGIQSLDEIQNNILTTNQPTARFLGISGRAGIQVIKYDSKTNARLAGAQFTIYDSYGRAVQVIQSNTYGVAQTTTLPLGNYSIKETKAPSGYQLESSPMYFSLMRNGQLVCLTKCNVALPNEKGGLQVVKTNENNQALAGAVFDVYNSNNQLVGRIVTGMNGVASLSNLPYGTYKLVEVQAPNGYELDSTPRYVTISSINKTVTIYVTNKKSAGSLQVIKKDQDGKLLANAYFQVYNSSNQLVGTIVTNANGIATMNNLPYGTYKILEIQAPNGYELDFTPHYVTISKDNPNGVASITIINKKKVTTGDLEVIKKDEAGKLLAGAEFNVYNASNQLVGTVTTDANGIATLKDLPYGTYKLIETKAPSGHELDQTPHYVTVSKNDPNGKVSITVINKKEQTTGDLEIIKKDEAGTLLAGAEFDVYNSTNQLVGKVTTDANGVATLTNLPYGVYKLIETKAPAGHELDQTPHYVTVSKNDPNGKVSITVINKKEQTTGDLEVIKKDEAGTRLAGAEFEVYDSTDQLVGKVTTDANGVATLTDLPYGTYKLIETKAPEGYELDTTPKYVTLSKTDPNGKATIEVLNKKEVVPETGSLKIVKYVKGSDPIEYLADAVFEVYDSDAQLLGTYTTDQNGEILLNDLAPGKYYAVEVKAPPGFEEDTTFYEINVEAGKVTEIRHANVKKENLGGLKITKYAKDKDGYETDNVLANAEFTVTDANGNTHTGTTDANGELFFPALPAGEVVITETNAPDGYEIDTAEQKQTIEVGKIAESIFYNKPKQTPGRALIYVSSTDAKQVINGLEYTITCTKGAALETTVMTNSFGQISVYLPPGEYEIAPLIKGKTTATTKSANFKIEASKFTIVKLSI